MIYLKVSQRVLNFLQMTHHFFQWFMTLQHLQHFLMMTYWKFLVGLTSGRWYLTQMPQNRLKGSVFSRKANTSNHETVYFNSVLVTRENIQKHLGFFLDSKPSFFDHINEKNKKATKGVNVIRKMNLLIPRASCLTIYKSLFRPHLDYDHVIRINPTISVCQIKFNLFNLTLH